MAQEGSAVPAVQETTTASPKADPPAPERKPSFWQKLKQRRLAKLLADPNLAAIAAAAQPKANAPLSPASIADDDVDDEAVGKLKAPAWVFLLGMLIVLAMAAVKPLLPEHADDSPWVFWEEVISLGIAEIGIALMIAYVIGWGIDLQAQRREARTRKREREKEERRRQAEQLEAIEREQRLVQDVFRGVLGIRHSSGYVRKVIETTLEQRVMRRMVNLIYVLRRLNDEEAFRIGDRERFMILDQAMSYEFQNLSSDEVVLDIRLTVPIRQGEKLRDESKLQSVSIGGALVPDAELVEQPNEEGQEGDAKRYLWKRAIPPLGKLPVAIKVRLIKEESDTEVWCSFYPCSEGMTLHVAGPEDLHMGIRANTASPAKTETDPAGSGMGVWKIDGPILPNDSVVFYWRTRVDEGEGLGSGAQPPLAHEVDTMGSTPPKARPGDSATGTTKTVGD